MTRTLQSSMANEQGEQAGLPGGIEPLDPRNAADVSAVVELHKTYLSDSPVVKLGDSFVRRFYYGQLLADGLIGCLVCRVDGRVVGFISFTRYPYEFMGRGLRTHFSLVLKTILAGLMARPAMAADILFLLRLMRWRRRDSQEPRASGIGEVLSLLVKPEFQNLFPGGGNRRVAVALVESAARDFQGAGIERFQLMVQPSNRAADVFWKIRGCACEKIRQAGIVVHRYTCDVNDR